MSGRVRPVKWLETNAADAIRTLRDDQTPYIITQDGEPKAVMVDIASYEQIRESLALLQLAAIGREEAAAGHARPLEEVTADLRLGRPQAK